MFDPTFTLAPFTIEEAADKINQPHEDYPLRVPYTVDAINTFIPIWTAMGACEVNTGAVLAMHTIIMRDKHFRGRFRSIPVRIGGDMGLAPALIEGAMERIAITLDADNLHEWYIVFQRIHPFEDGNGRVGGAIIAAASYVLTGGANIIVANA